VRGWGAEHPVHSTNPHRCPKFLERPAILRSARKLFAGSIQELVALTMPIRFWLVILVIVVAIAWAMMKMTFG
jgi:hypothetical protein